MWYSTLPAKIPPNAKGSVIDVIYWLNDWFADTPDPSQSYTVSATRWRITIETLIIVRSAFLDVGYICSDIKNGVFTINAATVNNGDNQCQ